MTKSARTTIALQGARVHNLKNISLEIPGDRLIVVTGLSGSGKSSLAFDTIYAEGQRRYMESLSSYAKRFVAQLTKPDVDFVFGLSPVISIEQKTLTNNPRSTVGTMTDIASYLNLLFATIGQAHCPRTGEPTPSRSASQIREAILSLPAGTEIELRAPVFKVYGEDLDFVFTELRKKGCRRVIVDGTSVDIAATLELDEPSVGDMDAIVDRFVVDRKYEKAIKAGIAAAQLVGDGLIQVHILAGASKADADKFYRSAGSATHHFVYGEIGPSYFVFNDPENACRTCGGLGVDKLTHPAEWLDKVMVERICPDCNGARLRATRLLFTIDGKNIHELGELHFDELQAFLGTIKPSGRGADAGRQVLKEVRGRLNLLLGIGLDYLA